MNLSLYSAATGMEAQQLNLNTIANNLANAHTTRDALGRLNPYRRQDVVFRVGAPGKPGTAAESIKWALSGFADPTVWLIFAAFMFALGYEKTGLGKRIALTLIKRMGRRSLGLGYAVALADLALAPFMPSNTARSGGTIFPIIKNIPPLYGSTPENNPRGLGAYLMWTALATTCVTSSMFLTALAPNLLAQSLVEKTAKIGLTWNDEAITIAATKAPTKLPSPPTTTTMKLSIRM